VADEDTATTSKNTAVTFSVVVNDADPDANGTIDATTVVIKKDPRHGSVVNHGDGTVTYTPDLNRKGSDTFTYRVEDDDGALSISTSGKNDTKVRINITQ
jgi:hypothetical protein